MNRIRRRRAVDNVGNSPLFRVVHIIHSLSIRLRLTNKLSESGVVIPA
jgi:hypothetical protein